MTGGTEYALQSFYRKITKFARGFNKKNWKYWKFYVQYLEMPMDTVILTDLEKEFYIYFHTKNEKNQTSKKR